jgi:Tfp pilus assembly protein PilF/CRP-like cAMP-binding protein
VGAMAEANASTKRRCLPRRYLRRVPCLVSLTAQELDWIEQHLKRREYAQGEVILRQGVRGDFLGIVERGQVGVVTETPGGRHVTATLHPGDFFAAFGSRDGSPRYAAVSAATTVVIWTMDQADLEELDRRPGQFSPSSVSRLPALLSSVKGLSMPASPVLLRLAFIVVSLLLAWTVAISPVGQAFLADLRYARGCWHLDRGDVSAALKEFEAAVETNPVHAASYNGLGYIYYLQGALEPAFRAFERAALLAADSDAIQNNLGLVLERRGQADEALKRLDRAVELGGNEPQVYVNLGDFYLVAGDWLNAGRYYREALRLDPGLVLAHHNLGTAYYRSQRLAGARMEFERAVELAPDFASPYLGLGVIAFEQGQFQEAQRALERAVELDPEEAVAYFYLGLIHKEQGHREQAADAFGRALGMSSDSDVREQAEWHLRELWGVP